MAEVSEFTDLLGVLTIPVARGQHHQLGVTERRILTTRLQTESVVPQKQIAGSEETFRAMQECLVAGTKPIRLVAIREHNGCLATRRVCLRTWRIRGRQTTLQRLT